jgi:hypothetical protein
VQSVSTEPSSASVTGCPRSGEAGDTELLTELLRLDHDDDLGSLAMQRGRLAEAKGGFAQLLERVRAALVGCAVLIGGIGSTEGTECRSRQLRGHPEGKAGERHTTVSGVRHPEPALTMPPAFIPM